MPKPPFRPSFQGFEPGRIEIKIVNEPLDSSSRGSAVFLVETGESRTRSETTEILERISMEIEEG